MGFNLNGVYLSGRLTEDRDRFVTDRNVVIVTLKIANNRSQRNSSTGEYENKTRYIEAKLFGSRAESLEQYLTKGKFVTIHGELDYRYQQIGDKQVKRYFIYIQDIDLSENSSNKPNTENQSAPSSVPEDEIPDPPAWEDEN
jgi:single-strand DNA-binding protein